MINLMFWVILFMPAFALAFDKTKTDPVMGIGEVAQNLLEPIGVLSSFINTACFVLGASFLFTCLIKYFEHRRSPLMVPISTVIFLLVAGILLILLPFVSLLTDSGLQS